MVIGGGEGICHIWLTAKAIASVLWLAVDGVARNTNGFLQNCNAALIPTGVGTSCINGSGSICFSASGMGICRLHAVGLLGVQGKCYRIAHQRHIVSAGTHACGKCGSDFKRAVVSAVFWVVFKQNRLIVATHACAGSDGRAYTLTNFRTALLGCHNQWLMSMLLGTECSGHILAATHHIAALVIEAEHRGGIAGFYGW